MSRRILYILMFILMSSVVAQAQQDSLSRHYDISDVVVTARQQAVSLPNANGNISVNVGALSNMPRIGGAVDVLKMLQYKPGVSAVEEGNTAMYVRGGDAGQSIILLNDAPLYSSSHLLGIFSVFNSAHLSGLTLYKSGIPAMYGSSTSSVLDVRTHRYIPQKMSVTANVGLIESDVAVQLPVGEKFALFASARHSYVGWLTKRIAEQDELMMEYNFGDYGLGCVADLGQVGKLIMNTHFNNDDTKINVSMYNSDGKIKWWNALASLSLETPLSDRVSLTNTLYTSIYDNNFTLDVTSSKNIISSGVQDFGIKSMASITFDNIILNSGINYSFRKILPQSIQSFDIGYSQPTQVDSGHEVALYANAKWHMNEHLNIDAGARFSLYANNDVWYYPEPRVMLSMPISSSLRFWAGYNMMAQYVQLVPQSNMSFATDFYIGPTKDLSPQLAHNFSLGYGESAFENSLRWTAEVYYRYMKNVIEFDSNIYDVMIGNTNDYTRLHKGVGESYGLETSLGYSDRSCDVQLNYTLSKSLRQFDEINEGRAFAAHSDRRHNLSFMASYKPSYHWTFSTTFVYASGAPYTKPKSLYISGNAIVKDFDAYNNYRLPSLHHLDLSITYWFRCRKLKYSGLNVSIYNIYAHSNPAMVSWKVQIDDENVIHLKEKYPTLYTILPSISWTMKF